MIRQRAAAVQLLAYLLVDESSLVIVVGAANNWYIQLPLRSQLGLVLFGFLSELHCCLIEGSLALETF